MLAQCRNQMLYNHRLRPFLFRGTDQHADMDTHTTKEVRRYRRHPICSMYVRAPRTCMGKQISWASKKNTLQQSAEIDAYS